MEPPVEPAVAGEPSREASVTTEPPFGPAAAVIVATGVGALVLGLLTTLSEASTEVHDFLEFDEEVGPLSGKTIIAGAAFFVAWAVLHVLWRRSNPPVRTVLIVTGVLLVLGLIGTFPTFFQAFASE
jgi:hypothetical protein